MTDALRYAFFKFVNLLEFLIFLDALLSWVVPNRHNNQILRIIGIIIDPIKEPFYRLQFKLLPNTPIDFSPMLAILFLEFIKTIIL
ncbi:MAG: YggT family protein [Caloramator sp.]|jgi:YggT family protein|uniref:YggT family protein n=1 Tax=Caloramator sp. TaxID=1871330 RepID=UPI001D3235F2|nr:YggT family protein [Caloramator sp.]MBZ4664058.1 YggT family protein [Caloramator sp.]